ncbi:MAG: response regulator [Nitrospirae bacterium]|nr:response regulator [Nitrospirota bacterium]
MDAGPELRAPSPDGVRLDGRPASARHAPTILVVEDAPDFQDLLQAVFRQAGFRTRAAGTSREALRVLARVPVDVILLDIGLPGRNGVEFLRVLRRDLKNVQVPVVVLSGCDEAGTKRRALEEGADDYLVKPFDLGELVTRIRRRMERNRALAGLNPLTELPGSPAIYAEIQRRIDAAESFALGYADLRNFKAVNDHFGPYCGDEVIRHTARILQCCLEDWEGLGPFLGHIGGDDFMFVGRPENAPRMADSMISTFDLWVSDHVRRLDGAVASLLDTRSGRLLSRPYLTLHIGIAAHPGPSPSTVQEVVESAARAKERAKADPGSAWCLSRVGLDGVGTGSVSHRPLQRNGTRGVRHRVLSARGTKAPASPARPSISGAERNNEP